MFEQVDFKSGEIRYCSDWLGEEDILLVQYPQNYVLELGWYEGRKIFVLDIIRDHEWGIPVARYTIFHGEQIETALGLAIAKIEEEIARGKPYYGGLWKTEEITI